jgi:6-pyruvoyltetrahydropterin/6-carboxytetrahydropterin synthase
MRCSLTRSLALHATHSYPESRTHGHLYRIDVTVTGALDPVKQMVMDLAELDEILRDVIVAPLAGRHLNEIIAGPAEVPWPTCEAIAGWCWQAIAKRLPATVQLARVRVAEDETLWADCTGPG